MPLASIIELAAALPPHISLSAARIIFRRWANAASIILKTTLRSASSPALSWRTNRTKEESTFGTGQKIERLTVPAEVRSAHQVALTEGLP